MARRLFAALSRERAVVVSGAPGSGKTALVLHTLREHAPDRLALGVYAGGAEREALSAVVRALAPIAGATDVAWSELLAAEGALLAAALDLADAADRWIVLDGLSAEETSRLSDALARYARTSRWILVTDATGLGVEVPPLPERGASPGSVPEQLTHLEAGVLALLVAAEGPLPVGALERAAGSAGASTVAALVRRRLASRRGSEIVASPGGRQAASPGAPSVEIARRATRGETDARVVLAATRALVASGAAEVIPELLGPHVESLLAEGYGAALRGILGPTLTAPPFSAIALRLGVELGDVAVLGTLALDLSAEHPDALLAVRAATLLGRSAAAADLAAAIAARAPDGPARFEAHMLEARALANLGRAERQDVLLRSLKSYDDASAARLAGRRAANALDLGDWGEARRWIAEARAGLSRLRGGAQREVRYGVARALYYLGDLRGAAAMTEEPAGALDLYDQRRRLTLRAATLLDAGDLPACHAAVEALALRAPPGSNQRTFVALLALQLRLYRGDLRGLEVSVEETAAECALPTISAIVAKTDGSVTRRPSRSRRIS